MEQERDMDVCGFGSVNVDYVVRAPTESEFFDSLEEGDERAITDFDELERKIAGLRNPDRHIGGSAVNAIHALRALDGNLKLSIVSPIGVLPDEAMLDELAGIDLTGCVFHAGSPNTCVSVVSGRDRALHTYNDLGGAIELLDAQRSSTVDALCRAKVIHVSSLLVDGAGKMMAEILKEVREKVPDVCICIDLGLPWASNTEIARDLLPLANVLFLTDEELVALLPGRTHPPSRDDEPQEIQRLQAEYACEPGTITILKRRARPGDEPIEPATSLRRPRVGGVMYQRNARTGELDRNELLRDALDEDQIVDSTGAGDFFASAVLAAIVSPQTRAIQTLGLATAMARHKFGHTASTAYDDLDQLPYGDAVPPVTGKIFVSHAHRDRELVALLLELLGPGMHERAKSFFCTSQPNSGVAKGRPLDETVLTNLRSASLVIFVITPSFLASTACIQELGGAQAIRVPRVSLLHPTVGSWKDIPPSLGSHIGVELDNGIELAELRDQLGTQFRWQNKAAREWEDAMSRLRALLKGQTYES